MDFDLNIEKNDFYSSMHSPLEPFRDFLDNDKIFYTGLGIFFVGATALLL